MIVGLRPVNTRMLISRHSDRRVPPHLLTSGAYHMLVSLLPSIHNNVVVGGLWVYYMWKVKNRRSIKEGRRDGGPSIDLLVLRIYCLRIIHLSILPTLTTTDNP